MASSDTPPPLAELRSLGDVMPALVEILRGQREDASVQAFGSAEAEELERLFGLAVNLRNDREAARAANHRIGELVGRKGYEHSTTQAVERFVTKHKRYRTIVERGFLKVRKMLKKQGAVIDQYRGERDAAIARAEQAERERDEMVKAAEDVVDVPCVCSDPSNCVQCEATGRLRGTLAARRSR